MSETIQLGDVSIFVTRKAIKNVHLSVHPPDGRVTMSAPTKTRLDVARAYAISKLGWIEKQREKLLSQSRETPREFVERESHYVWGRRHLLTIKTENQKPSVKKTHKQIILTVRPNASQSKREQIIHEWHRELLHTEIPSLIKKWEKKLDVKVSKYFLQRMKTKWGSCNHKAGNIRINTELVKKPKDLLEYVIVHEMAHLIAPTHSPKFFKILNEHYPTWKEADKELNDLPIAS